MSLTDAQKRAMQKYRTSDKGRYSKCKNNALSFLRNQATTEDLVKINEEIEKILLQKKGE